ncbi:MAG TPA: lysylphosphatidylglycerol synthase domain-containing protein [Gaiellaceae bacterium]|nr:lysylphosphatidylglycerol synthase domain-containing protein [Gaiellaceae bacterium]
MTTRTSTYLASALGVATLAVLAAFPQLLRGPVGSALAALAGAERFWLLGAAAGFVAAFACTVGAWRAALAAAGGRIGSRQAAARLGIGAMVNSFAPAKLGEAVKLALCARAVESESRLRTLGGGYAALTAARSLALVGLVVVASLAGALPIWPVFGLLGIVAALAALIRFSARARSNGRVAQLLQGLAELGREPRRLAAVVGWTLAMACAQLAATVCVAAALGLPHPVAAALVILPALELASAFPVTPGSIGIGSGAVAVALASRGIGMADALGVGFAMQGLQTLVSLTAGSLGALYLVRPGPVVRRWVVRAATAGASAALAALVGMLVVNAV